MRTKFLLRHIHYSSNYAKLNALYRTEDPWHMTLPSEQHRFEETNRFIKEKFGPMKSLLEIGCGEGHQSVYLRRLCDHLIGLDVSARAVERARKRCPDCSFLVGDIFSKEAGIQGSCDLAVACEVLYYIQDVPATLQRMQELGSNGLVTYLEREIPRLDQYVLSLPGVSADVLEFEHVRWRIAWWIGKRTCDE